MAFPRRRSPSPCERGAITWVTAVLIAGLASGAYLAWVWVPVWFVHYEVRQVVRDYGNQAVKNTHDEELLEAMTRKLRALDQTTVTGPDGRPEQRPTVDVSPQQVVWERDTGGAVPTLHVAFEYQRDVHYPIVDRWSERTMRVDVVMDIARAEWGPTR